MICVDELAWLYVGFSEVRDTFGKNRGKCSIGESRKKGKRTELAVAGSVDEGIGDGLENAGQELGGLDLVDEGDARHSEVCDGEGERERREGVMDQSFTVGG